ncbi:MAG: hypothetical protein KDC49_12455 [Saprospiraceae bacterium]|nr:hypothetical protein [Saprospiraceae bacterium]
MDQEASMVGLGWNINPGVINRSVNVIPDDFRGDIREEADSIYSEFNIRPNWTFGLNPGYDIELFGAKTKKLLEKYGVKAGLGLTRSMFYNNYNGFGSSFGINPSISIGKELKDGLTGNLGLSANIGMNSESGNSFDANYSFSLKADFIANKKRYEKASADFEAAKEEFQLSELINAANKMHKLTRNASYSNGGSLIPQSSFFTPTIRFPMKNQGYSASFKIVSEVMGLAPGLSFSGYFSKQSLKTNTKSTPAYGTLFSHLANRNKDAIHDFSREKDVPFSKDVVSLALTKMGRDIFSVSGQGIGGTYNLKRGDVGLIYDNEFNNTSYGGSVGFEVGGGNLIKLGGDFHSNYGNTTTGQWSDDQTVFDRLDFQKNTNSPDPNYEPAYFKAIGDNSVSKLNERVWEDISKKSDVRVRLDNEPNVSTIPEYSNGQSIGNEIKRDKREKRNESISYLNATEATAVGLEKGIRNYKMDIQMKPLNDYTIIPRTENYRKEHHISEITALRPDGLRYVYGIPAYNITQVDVSFNVGENTVDCNKGTVIYNASDASKANSKGFDHFYNKTTTPAYAHSYLLTSILSDDYSDLTNDGPTPDDLGSYTKINYHQAAANYRWRLPYQDANHTEGLLSIDADDKGSYMYGEKEYWILHSIESKTQIAFFYYNSKGRRDAHGVANSFGGKDDNQNMQQLERIVLYSRPDYFQNGNNAVPLKVAHFEFDYSLCQNVPTNDGLQVDLGSSVTANQGGKLTLKRVWFTYGKSIKGMLSPYKFTYSDTNPSYNVKAYNRWSTYSPIDVSHHDNALNGCSATSDVSIIDFPYIPQLSVDHPDAKINIDKYVSAWSLTDIKLPSGANIHVDYEADDYAYVQDKEAMQMVEIEGTSISSDRVNGNFTDRIPIYQNYSSNVVNGKIPLYGNDAGNGKRPQNYIYFKLSNPIDGSTSLSDANKIVQKKYLKDISYNGNLYFKVLAEIKDKEGKWEYVTGYYDLNDTNPYGAVKSGTGDYTHGYIQLKTTCTKDREAGGNNCSGIGINEANPISKAIWQFIRLNMPKEVHGDTDDIGEEFDEDAVLSVFQGMAQMFESVLAFAHGGYNNELRNRDFGKHIFKGKSWIRLYNPQQSKLGGTHRVKKITINDNWKQMSQSTAENSEYGQVYEYTTSNATGESISSGVAAYEPLIGGDEISLRLPDEYATENRLAPDDEHYLEHPYGESFYPGPTIIYSKVITKNIAHANVSKHATGYTVNEFFTAKDFPIKTRTTNLQQRRKKGSPILKLLKVKSKDNLTLSQGYVIELNDMHGKPKSTKVYDQWDNIVSGVEYEYQTEPSSNRLGSLPILDNKVKVINKNGTVEEAYLGLDYEMVADHRESKTKHSGGGVDLNNDNFLLGLLPIPSFIPYMMWSVEEVMYRSVTLTKVIRRSGILKKTTAFDLGSSVATNNLYYDAETGNPLVTQTFNEFEDPIYNFNYPAHWAYEGMEQAYQNIGMEFIFNNGPSTGTYIVNNTEFDKITPGDELLIGGTNKAWVLSKDNGGFIYMINSEGQAYNVIGSDMKAKIVRSGHRNMASASIGSVTSLDNPVDNLLLDIDELDNIINASAIKYDDKRLIHCSDDVVVSNSCNGCNPICENGDCNNLILKSFLEEQYNTILFSRAFNPRNGGFTKEIPLESQSAEKFVDLWNPECGGQSYVKYVTDPQGNLIVTLSRGECRCQIKLNYRDALARKLTSEQFGQFEADLLQLNRIWFKGIQFEGPISPLDCSSNAGEADVSILIASENGGFNPIYAQVINTNSYNQTSISVSKVKVETNCFKLFNCVENPTIQCNTNIGQNINPFVQNLIGNYKPNKSYTYLTKRKKSNNPASDIVNIQKDGTYTSFSPFWNFNGNNIEPRWQSNDTSWTWTSEITKVNRNGNEVESRDPLNRYSAELLGYHDQMVTAVAANARYQQIAFEGFEDIFYNAALQEEDPCINPKHFDLEADKSWIEHSHYPAHTGKYSLYLKQGSEVVKSFKLDNCIAEASSKNYNPNFSTTAVKCENCLGTFQPLPGKYVISAWITRGLNPAPYEATNDYIIVSSGPSILRLKPEGQIIEGWQRVFGTFEIPVNANELNIKIQNHGSQHIGVDDIRIHPFDASFKSYVYDEHSLRFTYELDENNYFTKYEYDISGNLERVKKETERGVMMIQESRFGQHKTNN